jgi:thioredoxin-dependent peroxiredoxin
VTTLTLNHPAPDFTALDTNETKIQLSDFKGQWLVLYFYPKDNTPGCTTEATEFSQAVAEFNALNAAIIGVSPDSCKSHAKFTAKHDLKINLIADADTTIAKAYGLRQLKKFMGKEYMGVVRSTFIIDPTGNIAHVWSAVKVKGHVAAVLQKLTALAGVKG